MTDDGFDEDTMLEMLISNAEESMRRAGTAKAKQFWFKRMQQFIKDRSPAQVAKMERERRLG